MQSCLPRQDVFLVDVYEEVTGRSLSSMGLSSWSKKEALGGQVSFSASGSVTLGKPLHSPLPHLKIRG